MMITVNRRQRSEKKAGKLLPRLVAVSLSLSFALLLC
jgi:hypothetical protein